MLWFKKNLPRSFRWWVNGEKWKGHLNEDKAKPSPHKTTKSNPQKHICAHKPNPPSITLQAKKRKSFRESNCLRCLTIAILSTVSFIHLNLRCFFFPFSRHICAPTKDYTVRSTIDRTTTNWHMKAMFPYLLSQYQSAFGPPSKATLDFTRRLLPLRKAASTVVRMTVMQWKSSKFFFCQFFFDWFVLARWVKSVPDPTLLQQDWWLFCSHQEPPSIYLLPRNSTLVPLPFQSTKDEFENGNLHQIRCFTFFIVFFRSDR